MATMKIMPSDKSQGDYVIIEESDFDPKIHEKYGEPRQKPGPKPKADKAE